MELCQFSTNQIFRYGQKGKGIKMDKTIHRKLKIEQHEVTPSFEFRVWCYIYIYYILSIDMTTLAYVNDRKLTSHNFTPRLITHSRDVSFEKYIIVLLA
jgi:hypothetical protein